MWKLLPRYGYILVYKYTNKYLEKLTAVVYHI